MYTYAHHHTHTLFIHSQTECNSVSRRTVNDFCSPVPNAYNQCRISPYFFSGRGTQTVLCSYLSVYNLVVAKMHIFLSLVVLMGCFVSLSYSLSLSPPSLHLFLYSAFYFSLFYLLLYLCVYMCCVSQSPRQMMTPVRLLPTTQSDQTSKYTTLVSD